MIFVVCFLVFSLMTFILIKLFDFGLKFIIKEIEEYKKLSEMIKIICNFMIVVILIPIGIYVMDKFNLFTKWNLNNNITKDYDWLSFFGTYVGTVISAMFLIIITKLDRDANTDSIREAQRPNLCTIVYLPNNFRITDTSIEGYIYKTNGSKNTSDNYIINITNSGQTVAVIDMEKSYFVAEKIKEQEDNNNEPKIETSTISFNKYEDRLHINSNQEINVVILDQNIKEIQKVYIEYSDLFNKRYKDEIEVKEGKSKVVSSNELITLL